MRKRQLVYGSLVIDLRADVKMRAVCDLMDSLIMCNAYGGDDFIYYGANGIPVVGQKAIRGFAYECEPISDDELPF